MALAQEAVAKGQHQELMKNERHFLFMHYMHSVTLIIHNQALPLFKSLNDKNTLEFEMKHREIIKRFGRYPHRNEILGRPSSDEERTF